MKPALIVVDMVNEFVHGRLATPEAVSTVDPARTVVQSFRKFRLPVIYVSDGHYPDDPEIRIWGRHSMKGDEGSAVIDDLKPSPADYIIEKHAYSGFYGTNLDMVLRSHGIDTVVLIGLDADICVRHTAADALYRNYGIVVVEDAVAARIDRNWRDYFTRVYGATIVRSDEIEDILSHVHIET
ncbi:cysteine hydrolase family protein [Thermoplasma sp.]|uniref:cysteine hydrolase family protein n=1 Tax=Thermoplasma sp. TaxID=1973142 RepID=UPI001281FE7E|nr:isochorismatase family cysteine hydrolase [Thermoplasma sp.]KAA8922235.1 MAG: cysteine hydrolase [Thermoplasma sp.]